MGTSMQYKRERERERDVLWIKEMKYMEKCDEINLSGVRKKRVYK